MAVVDYIREHARTLPDLAKFALVLALVVSVPRLSKRVGLPVVVGMLLCGVVIGPYGVDLFVEHAPVADFFSDLGKLLLMFFAGLETDLALFRKARNQTMTFGIFTTFLPLLLGTGVGILFGYHTIPAIVLGSLLASHTLIALATIIRLKANRLEPIVVTTGATVMSDTLSLVVFAVCVSTFERGFSMSSLLLQLLQIAIFIPVVLLGLGRIGAYLLKKVEKDEDAYFILMLAILAVAGLLADLINLPGIVGAFLAGLAVNTAVHEHSAKEKLEFMGNTLFIPMFFLVTGFLINPGVFIHTLMDKFPLAMAVIGALIVGKWIAAESVGRMFHYSPVARKTMWSLTLPQVAATLAATLAAYKTFNPQHERLLDNQMLNVVLVLVLTTSILGPVLTERFASKLVAETGEKPANAR
jgi:Kef-type K+ transport system membrane component KefB